MSGQNPQFLKKINIFSAKYSIRGRIDSISLKLFRLSLLKGNVIMRDLNLMDGLIENERFRKLLLAIPAKAIEILYDQYYRSLLRIAINLTHDSELSEDIVQETFVHVWQNHKTLGQFHQRSIQHYLVRIVRNKAITQYKRTKHQREQKSEFLNGSNFQFNDPPIEAILIKSETNAELRHLISTFPKRERECLLMKLDQEMTTEQIAINLNVSKKAVERSLTSANKRLRKRWLYK